MSWFDDVRGFMARGHSEKLSNTPTIPRKDIRDLCKSLLDEEYLVELTAALNNRDIVEIADAIGDSIYVLLFTAHCYGIPIDAVWDEIRKTNMAKVDGPQIYRDPSSGKILKPPGWKPPDIQKIVAWSIPRIELYCPFCRKQHLDLGEWRERPHATHLCKTTPNGEDGCGRTFTILPFVFGEM